MAQDLRDRLAEYQPQKAERPTYSSLLLPELQRVLAAEPKLANNVRGLFVITVTKKGVRREDWHLLFQGRDAKPIVSQQRPQLPKTNDKKGFPVVVIEVDDTDIVNFITGGLTGLKAFTTGRVKIIGDLMVAQQLEEVFSKAGGKQRAADFLKKTAEASSSSKAKL